MEDGWGLELWFVSSVQKWKKRREAEKCLVSACHGGNEPERAQEDRRGKGEKGEVVWGNKSKMLTQWESWLCLTSWQLPLLLKTAKLQTRIPVTYQSESNSNAVIWIWVQCFIFLLLFHVPLYFRFPKFVFFVTNSNTHLSYFFHFWKAKNSSKEDSVAHCNCLDWLWTPKDDKLSWSCSSQSQDRQQG